MVTLCIEPVLPWAGVMVQQSCQNQLQLYCQSHSLLGTVQEIHRLPIQEKPEIHFGGYRNKEMWCALIQHPI